MKKILTLLAALALATFGLAACGSSDSSSSVAETSSAASSTPSTGGGATVDVTADPTGQLKFTSDSISAKAGPTTIQLTNDSSVTHNLVLEDSSGNEVGQADDVTGGSSSFDTDLKPGTYTYFCSIDGHEAAGMKGTLTVK